MALRFIGPRGSRGRKAVFRGYLYTIQIPGTANIRQRWQCVKRPSCKAALRIDLDERYAEEIGEHTHVPDWAGVKAK